MEKKNKEITTVYIGDIKHELEELYKKGYSLKDIIKKGIEYIKIQETLPYNLNEIKNYVEDLKNSTKDLKEISISLLTVYQQSKDLNKKIEIVNKKIVKLLRRKKKKKKGLLARILNIFG